MGADGSVRFYDRDKFEAKFKALDVKVFYENFLSGQFYIQSLDNKKYLSRYYGDYYECDDKYHTVVDCYDPFKDEMRVQGWSYDPYHGENFMNFKKKQRKLFWEMIQFLEKECYITSWEVWT